MKLFLVEPLGDGGIAHYTYNLAQSLSQKNHEVFLITARNYELAGYPRVFTLYGYMFTLASRLIQCFPALDKEQGVSNYIRRFIKIIEYPFNVLKMIGTAIDKKHPPFPGLTVFFLCL